MESSKKLVALFLMCMIVLSSSSVHFSEAKGEQHVDKFKEAFQTAANEFGACYNECLKICKFLGLTHKSCEPMCKKECGTRLIKARKEKSKN
ncbi:hypothetical protein HAX54_006599 [Datura stramonium]|uniref:Uncharacterized protein n=1 Tax=Datura stramonium TaxID=4076 RepID=A0ABS8WWT8_DATST|nr:hypothetical protein [Datura stramonium]